MLQFYVYNPGLSNFTKHCCNKIWKQLENIFEKVWNTCTVYINNEFSSVFNNLVKCIGFRDFLSKQENILAAGPLLQNLDVSKIQSLSAVGTLPIDANMQSTFYISAIEPEAIIIIA